jgi:regulator of protease activity HflC (stomatin/prohibitin superfamily)
MLYGWLFAVLFIVLIAGGIWLSIWGYGEDRGGAVVGGIIGSIVSFLLFLTIPFSFRTVDAGEIAVVKELGKIVDTREAGTHFDFWMVRSYERYDTKVRQLDIAAQAYSNDKQTMDITMNLQYQVKKESVKDIALTYGGLAALEGRIQSVAIERTKAVLSSYTADRIIMERSTVSSGVTAEVEGAVGDNYHVDITMVALTNIDFSDAYEKAVEDKMVAEQAKLQKDYENQAAEAAAKTAAEVSKLEADAAAYAKEKAAEAEAKAIIIKAEADAQALNIQTLEVAKMLGLTEINADGEEVIKSSLTIEEATLIKEYIEYIKYLENWDGKLPTVMTDGSSSIMIPTTPQND